MACLIIGISLLPDQAASARPVNRKGKAFPVIVLPKEESGANITTALGAQLPILADWYGQTPQEFQNTTKRDKNLHINKQGFLHYACAAPQAVGGSTTTWGNTGTTYTAPYPDAQTFILHSKPGATKKIYLDFKGHTTTGTYWNSNYAAGADIVTPSYDIDGNPAAFSSQELANIQVVWQSVTEDFAPFDVDVTTEDPGVEALRKADANDQNYGIRVCIGGSSLDWYGASAGGVAYLNSFDWDSDTPAFVFPAQLGSGNPKFVAEACSHESGHTFGLHHNGLTNGTEYYSGQGDWAPIMGASYYVNTTQWSWGDYTGANNTENQLALLSGYLPYRTDIVGNTIANATALSGTSLSTTGLIATTGDVDVYSFTTGTGNISLTAKAAGPNSGNLNLLLSLYDSSGASVTTAGPSVSANGVALSTSLAAGTYYVAINGVGSGDPLTTGFSNYASIGQFSLIGSLVPANNQAPVAVASNSAPLTGAGPLTVNFSSSGSNDPDGTIASYSWTFGDGTTSTTSSPAHTYSALGTYTATLVVKDNYGVASAPVSVTVTVNANKIPVAVASQSTPQSGPGPLTVNFSSAGSNDTDGTVVSYNWTFGDGYASSFANPSHTYTAYGTYVAKLTVVDNLGASSTQTSVTIIVTAPNTAPTAVAAATPTTGNAPLVVAFSSAGSSDTGGSVASYSWNFGDGTSSTLASPSHTYTTVGTFNATLVVTDNLGLASAPKTVTITTKQAPYVYISALTIIKTKGTGGSYATATATVKDQTGALKSSATVYGTWSGLVSASTSGKTATNGTIALKSATTSSVGTITFTVTNIVFSGFTYDATKNAFSAISVTDVNANSAPIAMASATPTSGVAPVAVVFSSTGSSDPDGTIASYSWNFGDGTSSTVASPSKTYSTVGTFTATLVVKDNLGLASAPKSVTITVAAPSAAPIAVAAATPATGLAPLAVGFSSAGSYDTDGTIASYSWNFGDGTTSTAANPSHSYTTRGIYTATLTVKDNSGVVSPAASVTITVTGPNAAPTAVASATPTTGVAPLAVVFSSSGSTDSDGTIASYSWNFGDGTTSTAANPSKSYTTVGTFTATLVVTDNDGAASAPKTVTITTKPAPYVKISALTIIKTKGTTGSYATATATVKDQTGALKASATVYGTWSGLVSSSTSGRTSNNGTIALKSAATKSVGNITFTVTNIVLSGFTYSASNNTLSAVTIAVP